MKHSYIMTLFVLLLGQTLRANGEEVQQPGLPEKKKEKKAVSRMAQQPPQRNFQQARSDIVVSHPNVQNQRKESSQSFVTGREEQVGYKAGLQQKKEVQRKTVPGKEVQRGGKENVQQITTEKQYAYGTRPLPRPGKQRKEGYRREGYRREEHHDNRGADIGLGIAGALLGGAAAYEYEKSQANRPEYAYGYEEEEVPTTYRTGYHAEEAAPQGNEYGYQEGASVRGGFGYQRQVPAYDACLMRSTFSTLWAEQAVLLRLFIMASLNHTDTATIMNQFSENQRSLGDLFTLFYGQEIGDQFVTLLQEYTSIVQEVVAGSLQNRRKQEFVALWDHYADKMADFLVERNASWSKSSMVRLFQAYGSVTNDELFAIVQRDCKTDSALLMKSISKSQEIADKLASGIIAQFPG